MAYNISSLLNVQNEHYKPPHPLRPCPALPCLTLALPWPCLALLSSVSC
jgi:hypothetical protein